MLRQRGGAIINLSSIVGAMGNPGQANYVATKGYRRFNEIKRT